MDALDKNVAKNPGDGQAVAIIIRLTMSQSH